MATFTGIVLALLAGSGASFVLYMLYNVYLHPLSKYPGPIAWSATRLPWFRSFMAGTIHHDVRVLHQQYGRVVRIAPNELSFTTVDSWRDIYSKEGKQQAFPKSATWFAPQQGRPMSVHTALDLKDHARMRRAMDPGFTHRAMLRQEPILQQYVDLLVRRLRERTIASSGKTTVNIVEWLNFVAFDIIGDLGFGEPFGCLETLKYHDWMSTMFNIIRVAVSIGSLRHYPLLFNFLMSIVPASARKIDAEHWGLAVEKTDRRLALKKDREDLLGYFIKQGEADTSKEGLRGGEIYANAHFTIMAGSETTVTVLTGISNKLAHNPHCAKRLTDELRGKFSNNSEITLTAIYDLPYLNAVIEEGLRMCNPTPGGTVNTRITPPEGGIVSGNFVTGNTFVSPWPYAMSFDPEYFLEPHAFHPERWLAEAKTNFKSPFYNDNRKASVPFGVGLRACIGTSIANAEMRLVLAKLLWNFDLEKSKTADGDLDWDSQRVFGVVEKKAFDVVLVDRGQ